MNLLYIELIYICLFTCCQQGSDNLFERWISCFDIKLPSFVKIFDQGWQCIEIWLYFMPDWISVFNLKLYNRLKNLRSGIKCLKVNLKLSTKLNKKVKSLWKKLKLIFAGWNSNADTSASDMRRPYLPGTDVQDVLCRKFCHHLPSSSASKVSNSNIYTKVIADR